MANKVEYELSLRDLLSSKIDAANASVNRLEKSLGGVKKIAAAIGVGWGIGQIKDFAMSIVDVGSKMESFDNVIKYTSINSEDAAKNHEFLNRIIKDYKLPIVETTEGFSNLSASMLGSSLQGQGMRDIFEGVSIASTAMHLSADKTNAVFYALNNMMSNGTVQAQDLKLQLGNALPGAFNLAAKSMGKTQVEFKKMMENGEIVATEFLPKFAAYLKQEFSGAIPNAVNSTTANVVDLSNQMLMLKKQMFDDLRPAISSIIKGLSEFIGWVRKAWDWCVKYKKIIKDLAITLGEAWLAFKTIGKAKSIIEGLGGAFSSAATNSDKLGSSIGGVVGKVNTLIAVVSSAKVIGDWLANLRNMGSKKGEERGEALDMAAVEEKNYLDTLVTGKKIIDAKKAVGDEITKQRAEWQKYSDASLIAKDKKDYEDLYDKAQQSIVKGNVAKDFLKNLEKPVEKSLVPTVAANVAGNTASGKKKTGEKSQAVGSKAVTINVSIKDLIGTNNINVTNIKEMGSKVKEVVVSALMGAVNDFQITAGS